MKSLHKLLEGPIARGTIRTTFVLGLRLVVQAGTLLIVARMLGPSEFGAFAGVAALAVILGTLATFGTHLTLLGEVSKDPAKRDEVLRYALPTTTACGLILLGTFILITQSAFGDTSVTVPVMLIIGATEICGQPLVVLCANEHHARGRIARSQALIMSPLVLRLGAAAIVIAARPQSPLWMYAVGYGIATGIAIAIAISTLDQPWPAPTCWRPPRASELRAAASFAALNVTSSAAAELDKTLAPTLMSLSAAGAFSVASRIISAATVPISSMIVAALPRLFRVAHKDDNDPTTLPRRMTLSAAVYGAGAAMLLFALAPIFPYIFGPQYGSTATIVRDMCICVPGVAVRRTTSGILIASGRPLDRILYEAIGIALLLTITITLTPRIGLSGMISGVVVAEWAMAIMGIMFVYKNQNSAGHKDRI